MCFHVFQSRRCQNSLHEQRDSHVDWDELADGNSEDVSTRPEEREHSPVNTLTSQQPVYLNTLLWYFYFTLVLPFDTTLYLFYSNTLIWRLQLLATYQMKVLHNKTCLMQNVHKVLTTDFMRLSRLNVGINWKETS